MWNPDWITEFHPLLWKRLPDHPTMDETNSAPFIKLYMLLIKEGWALHRGIARRKVLDGLVKVNGKLCGRWAKKIYSGDVVEVEKKGKVEVAVTHYYSDDDD